MLSGGVHVDRVPIDDRCDDQVEAGCPILLRLVAAVDDPALAEGVDCLRQGMALFAVVETGMASPAQIRIFEPVQHEQGPLHLADFLKSDVELVLPFVGGQLSQHDRWRDMAGLDRANEAQHVVPLFTDDVGADTLAQ